MRPPLRPASRTVMPPNSGSRDDREAVRRADITGARLERVVDFLGRWVLRVAIAFPLAAFTKSLRILNLWAGGTQCKPPATLPPLLFRPGGPSSTGLSTSES